jgi:hypothetical protein
MSKIKKEINIVGLVLGVHGSGRIRIWILPGNFCDHCEKYVVDEVVYN